jgi:hypothetical protein
MHLDKLSTILSKESLPKCETCPEDNRLPGEYFCQSAGCINKNKYYCEDCQNKEINWHNTHFDTKTVHIIKNVNKTWRDLETKTEELFNDVAAKYKPHEQLILNYE